MKYEYLFKLEKAVDDFICAANNRGLQCRRYYHEEPFHENIKVRRLQVWLPNSDHFCVDIIATYCEKTRQIKWSIVDKDGNNDLGYIEVDDVVTVVIFFIGEQIDKS